MLEAAIEAGADDVESGEDGHSIWTQMDVLHEVAGVLEAALGEPETAGLNISVFEANSSASVIAGIAALMPFLAE